MDEIELARMIIRLGGDASEYQKMLSDATADTQEHIEFINTELSAVRSALEQNTPAFGMSIAQLQQYEQHLVQAGEAAQQQATGIDQQTQALTRMLGLYRGAQSVTQAMRTPTEVYRDRLNELKQMLDAGFISQETFNRAVGQAKSQMNNASAGVTAFHQSMSMANRVAYPLLGVLGSLGLSFGLLGTAVQGVRLSSQMEATQVDMEVLMGSADKAKALIGDLEQFSARTPLQMPQLLGATRNLMQFGVEGDNIIPILHSLGNAAGGSNERLQRLVYSFGIMNSYGMVNMRTMRQMATAGFNPLKEIAAMTGKTIEQVTERMHRGQLTIQDVVKALNFANREGGTFAGRLEKSSLTLMGLFSTMRDGIEKVMREIGNLIIEGLDLKGAVANITTGAQIVVAWLHALTPETRRMIAQWLIIGVAVGAAAIAWVLLAPVIGTIIGLITTLVGVVVSVGGAIITLAVSPIGLLLGALAALMIATGHGISIVGVFGDAWKSLSEYLGPAVEGIKNAIKARDLSLAFEIGWTQIKKSFYEFTKDLIQGWYDTNFTIKTAWEDTVDWMARRMSDTSYGIKKAWIDIKGFFQEWTPQEYEAELTRIMVEHGNQLMGLDKAHQKVQEENLASAQDHVNKTTQEISKLQGELDKLNKEAADKAAKVPPLKLPTVPDIDPNAFKPPAQKMHVTPVMHWEAALADSAEAAARINSYFSMMAGEQGAGIGVQHAGGGRGMGGEGMAGGGGGITAAPVFAAGMEGLQPMQMPSLGAGTGEDPTRQRMVDLLGKAVEYLATIAGKKPVDLAPANLG